MNIEMEILSIDVADETETCRFVLEWRLKDDKTIRRRKTVTVDLTAADGWFDIDDILRRKYDEAMAWGYFNMAAERARQMHGSKFSAPLDVSPDMLVPLDTPKA